MPKTKKPTRVPKLCFNKCPIHGYMSISIDEFDADGGGIGTRITPGKCCGHWDPMRAWELSVYMWESVVKEARHALRLAKKVEKERESQKLLPPPQTAAAGD